MMYAIRYTRKFADSWPFVAEHAESVWGRSAPVDCACLDEQGEFSNPDEVARLLLLGTGTDKRYLSLPSLTAIGTTVQSDPQLLHQFQQRGIEIFTKQGESQWAQSLAEFALGMTIASLRRIPQLFEAMHGDLGCWDYAPVRDEAGRYVRAPQFGDTPDFVNGTIAGKRVRIGGLGNIGSVYGSICKQLGADVAAWDPVAPDSVFSSNGIRRVHHRLELFSDADIAAPMMPERPQTIGLFDAACIDSIPRGSLLVLLTRAQICDMSRVRSRVRSGEMALAADVFDSEPLPLDDPLLQLPWVVTTPHVAGRTRHANEQFANKLLALFPRI